MEFLCTSDAARLAQVAPDTIRMWERMGRLPAIRTAGNVRLFQRDDVLRVAEERAASRQAHAQDETTA